MIMLADFFLCALSIIAFLGIRSAFKGVFQKKRSVVNPSDMAMSVIAFMVAVAVLVVPIHEFHASAPTWFWPLVALSVAGWSSIALQFALGIDPFEHTSIVQQG
jgi:hypothetical protein